MSVKCLSDNKLLTAEIYIYMRLEYGDQGQTHKRYKKVGSKNLGEYKSVKARNLPLKIKHWESYVAPYFQNKHFRTEIFIK